MTKCLVIFCVNRRGESENVTFHKLTQGRYKPWMIALGRNPVSDKVAVNHNCICSDHFTPDSYTLVNGQKRLKKSAVPTLLLKPKKKFLNVDKNIYERYRTRLTICIRSSCLVDYGMYREIQ
ncbi:hypothetical protein NQ317_017464 [Molorchus minor]|uniref:THAP-type domain-containing protein n=1 Tax=Molorchus minor TaxID=1323400 RepID=A0ABQ9IZN4_9CUCU|nr:hypothetical protein NQ317_017464 [Molorchus minor]